MILNSAPPETIFKQINPTIFNISSIENWGLINDEFEYPPVIRLTIEEV